MSRSSIQQGHLTSPDKSWRSPGPTRDRPYLSWQKLAFAGALLAIAVLALFQREPGLGPDALFLDDQWVAVLVRHATLAQANDIRPPVTVGFIALLKVVAAVADNTPSALQFLPLACVFAQIPLLGWVAYRWTGRFTLGLVAALLLAQNSAVGIYSLRVKPFTLDSLATVVLFWLAVELVRRPSRRRLATLAAVALVAMAMSFPAVMVGAVLVNVLALYQWRTDVRGQRHTPMLTALAYNAALLGLFFLLIHGHRSETILRYWSDSFMPLGSALPNFFYTKQGPGPGASFFLNAFPSSHPRLMLLLIPGLAWLAARRMYRAIGVPAVLILACVFTLSVLHLYPVGEPRTDIFAYPILILIAAASLTPPTRRLEILPVVGAALLAAAFARNLVTHKYDYPRVGDRAIVRIAKAETGINDALIIYPWANYAFGIYGSWPVTLVKVDDSTNRFYVNLRRERTIVLHESVGGASFLDDPAVMTTQLMPFLGHGYRRVIYVACTIMAVPHGAIVAGLEADGYHATRSEKQGEAVAMVFEKK
jgi:hypothetical protein